VVIVVDTSAWIDFFRGRQTPVSATLKRLVDEKAEIAVTETILMEVLAGAASGEILERVRADLIQRPILPLKGLADFEEAARIYRACRAAGHTLRNQLDCLVAVPTIHHGATLLHNDRDYETIARHTALKLEPLDQERQVRETGASYGRRRGRPSSVRARPLTSRARRSPARA
jgi:hypothetical protein